MDLKIKSFVYKINKDNNLLIYLVRVRVNLLAIFKKSKL